MQSKEEKIKPFVSVALCTFNGEKYLQQQIESILSQTYTNIELVIVDDHSTDNTIKIIKEFVDRNPRIRYQINDQTLGYNRNFEKAFGLCQGEFIAISDQDDIWLPGKLNTLVTYLQSGSLLVHSYNAEFKGNDTSALFITRSRRRFQGNDTRQLLFYNTVSGHTMMFHKKILASVVPFPENVYYDWWMALHATLQSSIVLHDEPLVLHRRHSENVSYHTGEVSDNESKRIFFKKHIATLETFKSISGLEPADRHFLEKFIALLKKERPKRFSFHVFFFFLRHARSAFYYRKKTFSYFYYIKYSLKKAGMKPKNWP